MASGFPTDVVSNMAGSFAGEVVKGFFRKKKFFDEFCDFDFAGQAACLRGSPGVADPWDPFTAVARLAGIAMAPLGGECRGQAIDSRREPWESSVFLFGVPEHREIVFLHAVILVVRKSSDSLLHRFPKC